MLGKELRKARIAAGLTQEELAFRAHLARNYVSLLELDRKSPTLKTLFDLCRALKIRPSTLIARIERHRASGDSKGRR